MVAGILITDKKAELRVRKSSLLLICDFGKSEDGFYLNAPASESWLLMFFRMFFFFPEKKL